MAWNPVITNIVTTPSLATTLSGYTTLSRHTTDLALKLDRTDGVANGLILTGTMSTPDSAVNKSYVDGAVNPLTTSLGLKANVNNPTLTGTVTVPTGTTSTSAVNLSQLQLYLPLNGGTVTGQIKSSLTPAVSVDLTNKAYVDNAVNTKTSAAYVDNAVNALSASVAATYMPIGGGIFTGTISGPNPSPSSNGNELATTSYVTSAITSALGAGLFSTETSVDAKLDLMAPRVGAELMSARVIDEDPNDNSDLVASHNFVHTAIENYVETLVRNIVSEILNDRPSLGDK